MCAASRRCGAWCACPALPKRMRGGSTVNVIVWSPNAFSTSTASKGFALQGIYDYHPLRPQAMARLEQLRTAQGVALPPRLKSEIKRELHRLELVVEM